MLIKSITQIAFNNTNTLNPFTTSGVDTFTIPYTVTQS